MRSLVLLLLTLLFALVTRVEALAYYAGPSITPHIGTAELIAAQQAVKPGEAFFVALHLSYPDEWHTYWQNPGDSGLATTLKLTLPKGWSQGPVHWPAPKRIEWQGIVDYGYAQDAYLLVPLTPPASALGDTEIRAKASWLICKNICMPESADLTLRLHMDSKATQEDAAFARILATLPKPLEGAEFLADKNQLFLSLLTEKINNFAWKNAEFFPLKSNQLTNSLPLGREENNGRMQLNFGKGSAPPREMLNGVLSDGSQAWAIAAKKASHGPALTAVQATKSSSITPVTLGTALVLALLGGIILNAMPCVFPILSLKALKLVNYAGSSRRLAARHGIAYTAGVVFSLLAVAAVLLLLKAQGEAVGWGFQLQSPFFVTAMVYLLFLIGLNLSGVFSVPGFLTSFGSTRAGEDSVSGTFFTGMLATLVATPCSAPFMASALGFALTQNAVSSFLVFIALGLGLALPYLLVSLSPGLAKLLPKPGRWMETFRQILAFPIYASLVWLIWVLAQQTGPAGVAQALSGLVILAFMLWLLPRLSSRDAKALFVLAVAILLYGLQNMPKTFSSNISSEARPYSEQTLNTLLAQHQKVLIDATAAWCLTCKVNEAVALSAQPVKEHFAEKNITLLTADWTNRNDEVTRFLARFQRQGVPLYVYYDAQAQTHILPQLLTPSMVIEATR